MTSRVAFTNVPTFRLILLPPSSTGGAAGMGTRMKRGYISTRRLVSSTTPSRDPQNSFSTSRLHSLTATRGHNLPPVINASSLTSCINSQRHLIHWACHSVSPLASKVVGYSPKHIVCCQLRPLFASWSGQTAIMPYMQRKQCESTCVLPSISE